MRSKNLATELQAKAEEILSTITTSGGGNPVDTDYSWSGNTRTVDGDTWFEIVHSEYEPEWLNGEFHGSDEEGWEHAIRYF